jgi:hypothetical protein
MLNKKIQVGTIRVKVSNLKTYQKTKTGWKEIKKEFPELKTVIKLFKSSRKFSYLVDKKDSKFLKGQLSKDNKEQGARIDILPNGKKLEKAYSLFSPHLKIHDQTSDDHWDVIYQNKGGTYSYVYTLEKRKAHRARKYKKVQKFEKSYSKLVKNVNKSLSDKNDLMALPMSTLLQTFMRVGNEIYFKAHGHKGLTTLTKNDLSVKGSVVTFDYIGKDGVPIKIFHKFSNSYLKRLKLLIKERKKNEFVFSKNGHPLHETDFKKAFMKYCGEEFYPHIVRSHHATKKVKQFLAKNRVINKEKADKLFMSIAHDLGHKKFNKKKQLWEEHYAVTVNSYVQPELLERVKKRIK